VGGGKADVVSFGLRVSRLALLSITPVQTPRSCAPMESPCLKESAVDLPVELWREVWLLACAGQTHHERSTLVASVCQQWRARALGTSILWNTHQLHLRDDELDNLRVEELLVILRRCGDLGLRLHLIYDSKWNLESFTASMALVPPEDRQFIRLEYARCYFELDLTEMLADLSKQLIMGRSLDFGTVNPIEMISLSFPLFRSYLSGLSHLTLPMAQELVQIDGEESLKSVTDLALRPLDDHQLLAALRSCPNTRSLTIHPLPRSEQYNFNLTIDNDYHENARQAVRQLHHVSIRGHVIDVERVFESLFQDNSSHLQTLFLGIDDTDDLSVEGIRQTQRRVVTLANAVCGLQSTHLELQFSTALTTHRVVELGFTNTLPDGSVQIRSAEVGTAGWSDALEGLMSAIWQEIRETGSIISLLRIPMAILGPFLTGASEEERAHIQELVLTDLANGGHANQCWPSSICGCDSANPAACQASQLSLTGLRRLSLRSTWHANTSAVVKSHWLTALVASLTDGKRLERLDLTEVVMSEISEVALSDLAEQVYGTSFL